MFDAPGNDVLRGTVSGADAGLSAVALAADPLAVFVIEGGVATCADFERPANTKTASPTVANMSTMASIQSFGDGAGGATS
jgi:hypothetical protein